MSVFYSYYQSSSIHSMDSIRRGDGQSAEEEEAHDDVVIDIKDNDSDTSRNSNEEKSCRICLESSKSSQIIELGCDCRGEIGFAHHTCAATWFSFKGNKVCEICGKTAKNANSSSNNNNNNVTTSTTTVSSERPEVRVTANPSNEGIPDNTKLPKCVEFLLKVIGTAAVVFLFIGPEIIFYIKGEE